MARVRPFRGWRYAVEGTDLSTLTAPPYDVVSDEDRAALLARDEHNVVALELPEGSLDPTAASNRYVTGAKRWDAWRASGVLVQDPVPILYVLTQSYDLGGTQIVRRAIIAEVGLEPFEAGIILPHERTLPKALGDRFELTKATRANLSQVFGLFDDPEQLTDSIFEAAMAAPPAAAATDDDGVTSTLWTVTDPEIAAWFEAFMRERRIFIADGHHRYTTALAYRDLMRGLHPDAVDPAFDYVMMALVNMDDPDLVVLPYHRIADADGEFDAASFTDGLARQFDITDIGPGHAADALDGHDRTAFVFRAGAACGPRLAVLKPDVDPVRALPMAMSEAWKSLDVTIVQELVLWPLLGIHPDRPQSLERLAFTKDPHEALKAPDSGHDVGIVMRATRLDQLRDVSLAGEIMPQKSTYFYPKLLSGLVFRSAE